jgi:hippurate hydrolase
MHLIQDIVDEYPRLVQWRHDFHRHPELCHEEKRTASRVADLLRSFGIGEVIEGVGTTGVVGVLRAGEGPAVALRADMDALPISEAGIHDHRSLTPDVCHACGHDGHMVMLLGAAQYLASRTDLFRGTVLFVFQPAEEMATGAVAMLDAGILAKYGVQSAYALHTYPGLGTGKIGVNAGTVLASVNSFTIRLTGVSGHAGFPHLCTDPIAASAAVVNALQTIASQGVDPLDSVVLAVTGCRSSSHAYNVVPETVELKGTARYLDAQYGDLLPKKVRTIVAGVATGYGVHADIDYVKGTPPLANTEREATLARRVAGELLGEENVVRMTPAMVGEDFAFFLERVPGALAFIGNGEDSVALHNPSFDFNDAALPVGASYFSRLVQTVLA